MQDNMRIHPPVQTVDPNAKIRPTKEPPVLNPIDPSRVTGNTTTAHAQSGKQDGLNLLLNHGSVYGRFINQLSMAQGLPQTLKKVLFEAFSLDGKTVKTGQLNSMLSELSEKLKLSPDQIVEALKYQSENQTKFSGGLFEIMRQMLSQNANNKELEVLIGRFLKAYNGFFSTEDTLKAIITNLKQITNSIPKAYGSKLEALIAKLVTANPDLVNEAGKFIATQVNYQDDIEQFVASYPTNNDDEFQGTKFKNTATTESTSQQIAEKLGANFDKNLRILKQEVIPFLSGYVSKTNDFGKTRNTITLLINNIARLNTSSRDEVIEKFVDLIDFCKFTFDMSDDEINKIKNMFSSQLKTPPKPENELYDSIAKLLAEGSVSSERAVHKTMYRDIATSLLLDNSVFMPLTHLFLPINYNGKFMFSELWIEKDGKNKTLSTDQKPITKLLINFDIKGMGFFEAILWICEEKVDIQFNYPSSINHKKGDIKDNIHRIFRDNGMSINNLVLSVDELPKNVQVVFKNLFDSRRGVDVTI